MIFQSNPVKSPSFLINLSPCWLQKRTNKLWHLEEAGMEPYDLKMLI